MFCSSHPLGAIVILTLYVGWLNIHKAGELELAAILMLTNINNPQNVEAYLRFLASKCPLTLDDMRYKPRSTDNQDYSSIRTLRMFKPGQSKSQWNSRC